MRLNSLIQVGTRIKELRKEKGISQKEFSQLVGIKYATYSNYENNNREPTKEQLEKIADKLDVSVDKLLGVPEYVDPTEDQFIKACEWLENAEISIDAPREDDGLQQYYLYSSFGIDCRLDKLDIIELVESSIRDANEIRDEIAINHIIKRLFDQ